MTDTRHRVAKWCPFPRSMCLWWYVPVVWRWLPWTKVPTVYLAHPEKDPNVFHHELGHVEDLWRLHPWFPRLRFYVPYLLSKKRRARFEAYAIARRIWYMLKGGGYTVDYLLDFYGAALARGYHLGWTADQARDLVEWEYWERVERDGPPYVTSER